MFLRIIATWLWQQLLSLLGDFLDSKCFPKNLEFRIAVVRKKIELIGWMYRATCHIYFSLIFQEFKA